MIFHHHKSSSGDGWWLPMIAVLGCAATIIGTIVWALLRRQS